MTTHTLWVICYFLALIVFINRYIAGIAMRVIRGKQGKWDETRDDYEPTVTAIIPMFNEGKAVKETLQSLLDSSYPHDKLNIICVDDCSTDDSYEQAKEVAKRSNGRLMVLRNRHNMGKRRSIIRATREAKSEIILSVDSDVVVDADAVRQLVRRFTDDRIAAVGGWIDVRNKHDNWLSRMQTVKYWYSYQLMKNLEWGFKKVMCLSGCLTAYRREVLIELEPVLENRSVLGVPIKYGEDRFLTRQIIKAGYLTTMTLDARCRTFVPTTLSGYFSQQLRWRRSNIVDYAGGLSHVWKLNPVLAIHFFSQITLLMIYPIALARAVTAFKFFPALVLHMQAVFIFGMIYRWKVRKNPAEDRVGAAAFVPLTFLMPVTYALLTPLALFTLDTSNWETRNHEEPVDEPTTTPALDTGARELIPEPIILEPAAAAAITGTGKLRAQSHAQVPAA